MQDVLQKVQWTRVKGMCYTCAMHEPPLYPGEPSGVNIPSDLHQPTTSTNLCCSPETSNPCFLVPSSLAWVDSFFQKLLVKSAVTSQEEWSWVLVPLGLGC